MTINYNYALSKKLNQMLFNSGFKITFAETFTGGAVCQNFTTVTGAAEVLECGYICYSKQSIVNLLHVPASIIDQYDVPSKECAIAMAKGALANTGSQIAVGITGVAGPTGGTAEKPIGTVWVALVDHTGKQKTFNLNLNGGRKHIRRKTIQEVLMGVIEHLRETTPL